MASTTQIVLVDTDEREAQRVERHLRHLEERWSRFLPDSDVSRLNAAAGRPVTVSPETITLVTAMVDGWRETGGAYDPTVLPVLLEMGYMGSIDDPRRRTTTHADAGHGRATPDDIDVRPCAGTVALPPRTAIDPGGIGKGLAADLAVAAALERGSAGALVSIGGDLSAQGAPPTGDGWLVECADPFEADRAVARWWTSGGGVATSSTRSRRWIREAEGRPVEVHHLVDPLTHGMSGTDLAAATVLAPVAWRAEVHATAALLAGRSGALRHLRDAGLSGLVIDWEGELEASPDLAGTVLMEAAQ